MVKSLLGGARLLVIVAGSLAAGPVLAQGAVLPGGDLPARDLPSNGGAGVRTGNITSTGETVPHPGASQSGGTTALDRGVEQEDNKIQSGICKGC